MVALILEAARARQQARQLRGESIALRQVAHAGVRVAEERTTRARTVAETGRLLRFAIPAYSPWSSLPWRRDDEALDKALVLFD